MRAGADYDAPEGSVTYTPVPERTLESIYNPRARYQYTRDQEYEALTGRRAPGATSGSVVTNLSDPRSWAPAYDQAQANRDAEIIRMARENAFMNGYEPVPPYTGPQPQQQQAPAQELPRYVQDPNAVIYYAQAVAPPKEPQQNWLTTLFIVLALASAAYVGYRIYKKKSKRTYRRRTPKPTPNQTVIVE